MTAAGRRCLDGCDRHVINDKRLFVIEPPSCPDRNARRAPTTGCRSSSTKPPGCSARRAFTGTSMRDIVRAVAMLPGSLYYHFATKDLLLAAVYAEGVRRITERVQAAIDGKSDPWERLEAACVAHLEALLEERLCAGGDTRPPEDVTVGGRAPGPAARRVRAPVRRARRRPAARPRRDRRSLRLLLLGALNWSQTWYRPGRDSPRAIARRFVTPAARARPARSADATSAQGARHQNRPRRPRPRQPRRRRATCATPAWRWSTRRRGRTSRRGQARDRGGRRRDRHPRSPPTT